MYFAYRIYVSLSKLRVVNFFGGKFLVQLFLILNTFVMKNRAIDTSYNYKNILNLFIYVAAKNCKENSLIKVKKHYKIFIRE